MVCFDSLLPQLLDRWRIVFFSANFPVLAALVPEHSIAQSIASNESLIILYDVPLRFLLEARTWQHWRKKTWGLAFSVDPCCNPTGSIWIMESPNRGWIQLKARNRQLPLYIHLLVWRCWQCLFRSLISSHCICSTKKHRTDRPWNHHNFRPPRLQSEKNQAKTSLCCHVLGLDGVVEMSWPGWGASLGWLQTFWQQLEFGNHKHHFYKSVP